MVGPRRGDASGSESIREIQAEGRIKVEHVYDDAEPIVLSPLTTSRKWILKSRLQSASLWVGAA